MIFVTGGTGLVGSHLLFELAKAGNSILALKRPSSNIALTKKLFLAYSHEGEILFNHINWIDGHIEDYQSICHILKGVSEVYHCAAMVSFNPKDLNQMLDINVRGTANLVDACLVLGISKFCHVSSIASLGSSENGLPVSEDTSWGKSKGKSNYAVSKFRSEMEVWRAIEQGLNAVIINPSVIIGPCQWHSGSGRIFGTISKGFPFYTLGISGYVDVRDVVLAMLTAMNKECWGKRFIINSENISHRKVFEITAFALGKKPPKIHAKPWMTSIVWRIAWLYGKLFGKSPAVTRETAQSGHNTTFYSSGRSVTELGIKYRSVEGAIYNTVAVGPL
jgi:dihydroflavonol-4-reductase